jgi:hypothetical protein
MCFAQRARAGREDGSRDLQSGDGARLRRQAARTNDPHARWPLLDRALAKIAAGSRTQGTPDENKAVVHGSIAHTGRYTIDDGGKSITFHIETSTFPNWNGTSQKRALKLEGDTLSYTVTQPSAGGAPNDVVWKRIQ